jgi:hypothetical protein
MPGIEIKGRSKIANYRHGGRTGKFGGGRTNLLEQLGRVEAEPSNPNRRAEISRVHGELNRGYAKGGRAGYAIGSIVKGGRKIIKKISDAARKQDLADSMKRFEHAGPHEGEVITKRILGKGTKKGDRTKAAVKDAMEAKPWVGKPHAKGGRIGLKEGKRVPERPKEMEWRGWTKRDPKVKERPWGRPKRGRELTGDDPIIKSLAGGVKGKPHSSKEGRYASAKRKFGRIIDDTKYDPNPFKGGRALHKKGGKADKKWIQKAVNPKHKGYCTPMTKKTCTPARKALARTFKKKAKTGW